ncbi:hypothetical protein ACH5RR_018703 [Cinchona calisaya]|uniref:Uncharacterized protein n=1 Tax=Cinchona calisaya TaxID=153742 RepID=A0ABD2ZMN4_9GENT
MGNLIGRFWYLDKTIFSILLYLIIVNKLIPYLTILQILIAPVGKRIRRFIGPMLGMRSVPSSSNPISQRSSQANQPHSILSSKPTTRESIGPMLGVRIEPASGSNPVSQSSSQAN